MMLDAKRLYLILCGLAALAVVALAGGVYAANAILQKKSEDVRAASLNSLAMEERLERLRKAEEDIDKYEQLAEVAESIVPRDKDQSRTVREINKLAEENNIKLGSVTFPSSSLGESNNASIAQDSQLQPVTSIPGTFVLNITIRSANSSPASLEDFLKFLEALEQNRRTALVTGITLTPNAGDPSHLQFTLTLDQYIKP